MTGGWTIERASQCSAAGGVARGVVLADLNLDVHPEAPGKRVRPFNAGALPAGLANLGNDVDRSGINGRTWTRDTYDCDDFAGDLEKFLQALGYDATFTLVWDVVPNPDWRWWNQLWTPRTLWRNGHAVTDVHVGGRLIWIEPQWSSAEGAIGINLDGDGDGRVGYSDNRKATGPTDGSKVIEVWPSRAAAEKAGRKMD
jgi:hypothetical protein